MKGLVSPRMKLHSVDISDSIFFVRIYAKFQIRKTFSGIYNHKFVLKNNKESM